MRRSFISLLQEEQRVIDVRLNKEKTESMAAKKTQPAKGKATKRTKKPASPPVAAKVKSKANTDLDDAVEEIMESIDGDDMVVGEVPQETSLAFYERIASTCRERAIQLREEVGEDAEEDDDDEVDVEEEDDSDE